jgi:hypothetical protein
MTRSEQQKIIQDLRYYARSMSREDLETFEMLSKRDRDDEDLDRLSEKELLELHERYVQRKTKKEIEERWKKLTSKGKSEKES